MLTFHVNYLNYMDALLKETVFICTVQFIALQTLTTDDFAEGVLLHLYTDWKWDIAARDKFIEEVGGDWFP